MTAGVKRRLVEAIHAERTAKPTAEKFVAADIARSVIRRLAVEDPEWETTRDGIVLESITALVDREERKAKDATESLVAWLPFPEFQHISAEVRHDTLETYRERITTLEARIKSYKYPRRSDEKVKLDKRELREMKRLEPKITPFCAGDPAMTVGRAVELYQKSLQTPIAARNRRLASKGGQAKNRRTANQ